MGIHISLIPKSTLLMLNLGLREQYMLPSKGLVLNVFYPTGVGEDRVSRDRLFLIATSLKE